MAKRLYRLLDKRFYHDHEVVFDLQDLAVRKIRVSPNYNTAQIKRALAKCDPSAPHESLLVVDATTGSIAVAQAREFDAAAKLTGIIVTKLDGSGKGGVVVAIKNELGLPTRFIGTGEKLGDFAFFESREFVEKML